MRLLKTGPYPPGDEKLEIIQKCGKDIPPYAILSHTWSPDPQDEVLLADVQCGNYASKPAYAKVKKAMECAKLDGYGWLWIDTCCIDKNSSAELSESINSMFSYYRDAQKGYGYLIDVESQVVGEEFRRPRWWKRGWTLQELLAPSTVEFFNSGWRSIGYRDSLHQAITDITGIERQYLTKKSPITHASIAKRMSWASTRQTTRDEDMAYSLLGIFDVNMPMLYGEGATRAFLRLQEEIMRGNEDHSLFAWVKCSDADETSDDYHGMLADSPKDFARTGNTIAYTDCGDYNPSTMTSRGLSMSFPITAKSDNTAVAALRCTAPGLDYNGWLAVYLRKLPIGKNQYARIECDKLASISKLGKPQEIYVRQQSSSLVLQAIYPYHFLQLRSISCVSEQQELADYKILDFRHGKSKSTAKVKPLAEPVSWSAVPLVYQMNKAAGSLTTALLIQRSHDREAFVVMLGTSSDFAVGVAVHQAEALPTLARLQDAFSPQPPDRHVELNLHRVRVTVEERIQADQKIFFVDIEINAFPPPITAAELIQDAVEVFHESKKRTRAKFRDKIKQVLPK